MRPDRAVTNVSQSLDYHEIVRLVPYGADWLQFDRVLSWNQTSIVVQKCISGADRNMAAHLKHGPSIMPGVLHIEVVNQALMLLMLLLNMIGQRQDVIAGAGVMGRCKARYYSPAYIGETITVTVTITQVVGRVTSFEGTAMVGDRLIAKVSVDGTQMVEPVGSAAISAATSASTPSAASFAASGAALEVAQGVAA